MTVYSSSDEAGQSVPFDFLIEKVKAMIEKHVLNLEFSTENSFLRSFGPDNVIMSACPGAIVVEWTQGWRKTYLTDFVQICKNPYTNCITICNKNLYIYIFFKCVFVSNKVGSGSHLGRLLKLKIVIQGVN